MNAPRQTKAGSRRWILSNGPGLTWLGVFFFLPLLLIVVLSFLSHGAYGEVRWDVTAANYLRVLGFTEAGFDPAYPRILLRSLALAAGTTLLCATLALPLCFFIAGLPERLRHAALLLVVIPFWTNLLIRSYAWQILFAGTGWLAHLTAGLGLTAPGDALYPGTFAVFTVMTCDFLPFLALPLYASVEKIDWSLAEAASDLGAGRARVFWHALLPQIKPGLAAGAILVFTASVGQFVIPDLLGGAKTVLLGNAIQQQFGFSRNWPFGSALACVGIGVVAVALYLSMRAQRGERKEFL